MFDEHGGHAFGNVVDVVENEDASQMAPYSLWRALLLSLVKSSALLWNRVPFGRCPEYPQDGEGSEMRWGTDSGLIAFPSCCHARQRIRHTV